MAEQLSQNPRGLLCDCDELASWLCGFDQYRQGKGADVARWLSMHRAEQLLVDRKTGAHKTIFVKHAAVSLTGGIQPGSLRRALGVKHFENGLAARLLIVSPPRRRKRWTDATVDASLTRRLERVFARLLALDFGQDENGYPTPVFLQLSPEAKPLWIDFYDAHAGLQADASGDLAAVLSKLEGTAPRFALLDHLVRWAQTDSSAQNIGPVGPDSIDAGVRLARWFAGEAARIYGLLAEDPEARARRQLVEWIERRGGRVTPRELAHGLRAYRNDPDGAEAALRDLAKMGYGHMTVQPPGKQGGRPTVCFELATGVTVTETPATVEETEVSGTVTAGDARETESDDWGEL